MKRCSAGEGTNETFTLILNFPTITNDVIHDIINDVTQWRYLALKVAIIF